MLGYILKANKYNDKVIIRSVDTMSRDLFIKNEFQQKWVNKIENHKASLQKHAEKK